MNDEFGPIAKAHPNLERDLTAFGCDGITASDDASPDFVIDAIREGEPLLLVWIDGNNRFAGTTPAHPIPHHDGMWTGAHPFCSMNGAVHYSVNFAHASGAIYFSNKVPMLATPLRYVPGGNKWTATGKMEVYHFGNGGISRNMIQTFQKAVPLLNPHINEEELNVICALGKKSKFNDEVTLAKNKHGKTSVIQLLAEHCTTNLAGTVAQIVATTGLGASGVRRIRVMGCLQKPDHLARFLQDHPIPATVVWELEGTEDNVDDIVTLLNSKPRNLHIVRLIKCDTLQDVDLTRIIEAAAPHLQTLLQTRAISISDPTLLIELVRKYPTFQLCSPNVDDVPQQGDQEDGATTKLPQIVDVDDEPTHDVAAASVQEGKAKKTKKQAHTLTRIAFFVPTCGKARKVHCCRQRATAASQLVRGMLEGEDQDGAMTPFPIDTSFPVTKEAIQLMVHFMETIVTDVDLKACSHLVDAQHAAVYLPPHFHRFLDVVGAANPYRKDHLLPLLSQLLELAVYFNIDSLKVFVRSAFVYDMAMKRDE